MKAGTMWMSISQKALRTEMSMFSRRVRKGASFNGYNETIIPGGKVSLKSLHPLHGEIPLRFVVSGKDPGSSGYAVGLDAFALRPYRAFIPAWYICGPFANPQDSSARTGWPRHRLPTRAGDQPEQNCTGELAGRKFAGTWQKLRSPDFWT